MDALIILVCLVAALLAPVLLVIVILYIIPVRTVLEIRVGEGSRCNTLTVSWLCIGIKILQDLQGLRAEARVVGRLLYTYTGDTAEGDVSRKRQEESAAQPLPPGMVFNVVQRLIRPVMSLGSLLWQESSFEQVRGRIRLGLGDPSLTGMFYGYYRAAWFMLDAARIHIEIEPVFDRQVLDGDIEVHTILRHPLRVLIAAIRFLLDPAVRSAITVFRQGTAGVAAA